MRAARRPAAHSAPMAGLRNRPAGRRGKTLPGNRTMPGRTMAAGRIRHSVATGFMSKEPSQLKNRLPATTRNCDRSARPQGPSRAPLPRWVGSRSRMVEDQKAACRHQSRQQDILHGQDQVGPDHSKEPAKRTRPSSRIAMANQSTRSTSHRKAGAQATAHGKMKQILTIGEKPWQTCSTMR